MRVKYRSWLVLTLVAMLSCLLLACLAEIVLRCWYPLHTADISSSFRYDEVLGFRYRTDIHELEVSDHLKEDRINGLGTANFQEGFSGYPYLVFALGDSYTKGTGLPADDSYPFQLELELNLDETGRYVPNYGVVNLGTAGYGGEQCLLMLKAAVQRIGRPGVVIYMGSDNDAEDDLLFRSGYRHKHLVEGSPYWSVWYRKPVAWLLTTELGKRLKLVTSRWRRQQIRAGAQSPETAQSDRSVSVAERQAHILDSLHAVTQRMDARLIVSWAYAPSASYEYVRRWAGGRGTEFIDWAPGVESVLQALPALPVNNAHSGGHRRSWVMRVIAERAAVAIRRDPSQ